MQTYTHICKVQIMQTVNENIAICADTVTLQIKVTVMWAHRLSNKMLSQINVYYTAFYHSDCIISTSFYQ